MSPMRYITRFKKRAVRFIEGDCTEIDPISQTITVEDNSEIVGECSKQKLPYDYLVVAVGAENATFNIPGVKEHACFLKEIWDASKIRNRLMDCLVCFFKYSPSFFVIILNFYEKGKSKNNNYIILTLNRFFFLGNGCFSWSARRRSGTFTSYGSCRRWTRRS